MLLLNTKNMLMLMHSMLNNIMYYLLHHYDDVIYVIYQVKINILKEDKKKIQNLMYLLLAMNLHIFQFLPLIIILNE